MLGAQVPGLWHWSEAVHVLGVPALQLPAWQVSLVVHLSPSSQPNPSFCVGFEQVPVAGEHVPALWHWSLAVQVTGLVPMHLPA